MEKWRKYIKQYPELEKRWNNIPEATNTLFCGQIDMYARNLSIEFAEWCDKTEMMADYYAEHTHTKAELFDLFLNQKEF